MNHARALRVALTAMRAEKQRLAVQANLFKAGCDTPGTRTAAKRYQDLNEAIALLEQPQQVGMRLE